MFIFTFIHFIRVVVNFKLIVQQTFLFHSEKRVVIQAVQIAFIFNLILIYFNFLPLFELECKIVKIPVSVLDYPLGLRGKESDKVREKIQA